MPHGADTSAKRPSQASPILGNQDDRLSQLQQRRVVCDICVKGIHKVGMNWTPLSAANCPD